MTTTKVSGSELVAGRRSARFALVVPHPAEWLELLVSRGLGRRYRGAVDVKRAADLYAQGWTLRQIGAELGVNWSTVEPTSPEGRHHRLLRCVHLRVQTAGYGRTQHVTNDGRGARFTLSRAPASMGEYGR